ncbi:MAG: AIPR family protein [Lachnospiraceae bacterium]|nr:AIPR family protein [Lachnospiraceae bacterium]
MAKKLSNNQLLLKECIQQEYEENGLYDKESSYFEFFAASQVLKNYDLSDDEVASGIIGGGNDGGCDGMYVFLNNDLLTQDQVENLSAPKGSVLNLVVVQAKNTTGFSEDAIMKWKTTSNNLLSMSSEEKSFVDRYNEQVRESFMMFRDAITKLVRSQIKIQIHYYYVTLADEKHPNIEEQANELKELVKSLYPTAMVAVDFVGADKLMELYNTDTEVCVNLEFVENPIARGKNSEFISLINLGTYYKFITDDNDKLRSSFFEANVRDYQGKNSVNTCIAKSLASEDGEDFWWLNNGITILAEKASPITNKELLITNPEIVNGLQTSTEIYNYFSVNKAQVENEKRNVLVRVIVPTSEESRDNIIFATNNQTNIPKSSLRVTDTIHLQIEMYFKSRGLYYDRRKNYYKNQKKKATDIVGVSFLAQCLISIFLRKPDFARARPSTLLTDDDTYKNLYETNADLEVYYKTALLGKKVQTNLTKTSDMTSAERNDVLYYLLYGVAAKIFGKKNIQFSDVKNLDLSSVTDEVINDLKLTIYHKYKELGGNGRVAKSDTFINEIDILLGL